MASVLEDQVHQLQQKLSISKAYRLLSEWLNNAVPANKKLLKAIGDPEILNAASQHLSTVAIQQAEELETGKYVEKMELSYDDLAILKQMIEAVKNKNLK